MRGRARGTIRPRDRAFPDPCGGSARLLCRRVGCTRRRAGHRPGACPTIARPLRRPGTALAPKGLHNEAQGAGRASARTSPGLVPAKQHRPEGATQGTPIGAPLVVSPLQGEGICAILYPGLVPAFRRSSALGCPCAAPLGRVGVLRPASFARRRSLGVVRFAFLGSWSPSDLSADVTTYPAASLHVTPRHSLLKSVDPGGLLRRWTPTSSSGPGFRAARMPLSCSYESTLRILVTGSARARMFRLT